jgi:phospho-N-acetylmuramoyl-pentapeptide-transferase
MLHYLLFTVLSPHYSWLNVFKYQTFRALACFFFSFCFVIIAEPLFIKWIVSRGVGAQPIRSDGPEAHLAKKGTPTMGGIPMVFGVFFSSLLFCDLRVWHIWIAFFILIGFAILGFVDDWKKITKQNSKGVSGKQKLLWQSLLTLIVALILYFANFSPSIAIPFFKNVALPLGVLFVPFVVLVVVGTSNAVNITDGLDGLAIVPVMTVAFTYAVFCYVAGHLDIAKHLQVDYFPYLGEFSIVLSAVIASGLGFLWYNTFPAQVMMGDVGALSLGGILGISAILARQELMLVIAGGVFVLEALSVIIQRYSYKWRRKRVFKMAPIHHHFELIGWPEPKIIVRFWIISILLALIALSTLKLR